MKKIIKDIAEWLLVVGGLNWGLVALLNVNLVTMLSALLNLPILATIIYVVVVLAAILVAWQKIQRS